MSATLFCVSLCALVAGALVAAAAWRRAAAASAIAVLGALSAGLGWAVASPWVLPT